MIKMRALVQTLGPGADVVNLPEALWSHLPARPSDDATLFGARKTLRKDLGITDEELQRKNAAPSTAGDLTTMIHASENLLTLWNAIPEPKKRRKTGAILAGVGLGLTVLIAAATQD